MRRKPFHFAAAFAAVLFLHLQVDASTIDTSCLLMESPGQGSIITTPLCTISVHACGQVASVQFKAQFSLPDRAADSIVHIGPVSSPPFKLVWNTESLPVIVYRGLTLQAEALLKNGSRQTVSRQGIFVANKPIFRPVSMIPFAKSEGSSLFSQSLSSRRLPVTVNALACWNDDALRFTVQVLTPVVFSTLPREMLSQIGLELFIDPQLLRRPYPSDSTVMFSIPLEGVPLMTLYKASWSADGSFNIATNKVPASCIYDIRKEDTKGFVITLAVPKELFAGSIPDSFGCNIVVKTPGDNNQPVSLSWNNAAGTNAYCPLLWGTVRLMPRPFFQNRLVQWFLAFIAGMLLALAVGSAFLFLKKKSPTFENFEQSEEEKKFSDKIYLFIEETITKKDISLHWVAQKLDISANQIERLIKKYKGKSFKDYIMFLRIEIARERLRSSHASEKSIAESSGFKNVSEMEKYFFKFFRTTPYKFRKENQVA